MAVDQPNDRETLCLGLIRSAGSSVQRPSQAGVVFIEPIYFREFDGLWKSSNRRFRPRRIDFLPEKAGFVRQVAAGSTVHRTGKQVHALAGMIVDDICPPGSAMCAIYEDRYVRYVKRSLVPMLAEAISSHVPKPHCRVPRDMLSCHQWSTRAAFG